MAACSVQKCKCAAFKPQKWASSKCHLCFHWDKEHQGNTALTASYVAPPPAKVSSAPSTGILSGNAKTMAIWEWTDDATNWTAFLLSDIEKVEGGYQKAADGEGFVEMGQMSWNSPSDSTRYRFDYLKMTQTNLSSKKQRGIRRRADVPCCPRKHEMIYNDNYRFVCGECNRTVNKEGYYKCQVNNCFNRCLRCQGMKMLVKTFSSMTEWHEAFERLSQAQLSRMTKDVSCSAELRKENMSIVWRSWSDVGRSFESEEGANTTDLTFFALAPQKNWPSSPYSQLPATDAHFVNFPAIRTPNYYDEVDVLKNTDQLKFTAKNRSGMARVVTLTQFLENIGTYIADLDLTTSWADAIDSTPLQLGSQFSVLPIPAGRADIGVAAFGQGSPNLHVIIGPSGDVGWAPETAGGQRVFFKSADGRELKAISLVPEERVKVKKAFFRVEVHEESVAEEKERYVDVKNRLLHLQIEMAGIPALERIAAKRDEAKVWGEDKASKDNKKGGNSVKLQQAKQEVSRDSGPPSPRASSPSRSVVFSSPPSPAPSNDDDRNSNNSSRSSSPSPPSPVLSQAPRDNDGIVNDLDGLVLNNDRRSSLAAEDRSVQKRQSVERNDLLESDADDDVEDNYQEEEEEEAREEEGEEERKEGRQEAEGGLPRSPPGSGPSPLSSFSPPRPAGASPPPPSPSAPCSRSSSSSSSFLPSSCSSNYGSSPPPPAPVSNSGPSPKSFSVFGGAGGGPGRGGGPPPPGARGGPPSPAARMMAAPLGDKKKKLAVSSSVLTSASTTASPVSESQRERSSKGSSEPVRSSAISSPASRSPPAIAPPSLPSAALYQQQQQQQSKQQQKQSLFKSKDTKHKPNMQDDAAKEIETGLLLANVQVGATVGPTLAKDEVPFAPATGKRAERKPGVAVRATWMYYGVAGDGGVDAERLRRFIKQMLFERREKMLAHGSLVSGYGSWGGPENAPIKLFGLRLTDACDAIAESVAAGVPFQLPPNKDIVLPPFNASLPINTSTNTTATATTTTTAIPPVKGIAATPVLPLKQACQPLHGIVSGIEGAVNTALQRAPSPSSLKATNQHTAAVYLYTMASAFYRDLNAALRNPDRSKLMPYYSYLRLLAEAMVVLPTANSKVLWRGVGLDLEKDHQVGADVTWWGVSSCTPKLAVANGFLGSSGPRTLFSVHSNTAVPIQELSAFKGEEEFILAPGTRLAVDAVKREPNGLVRVTLKELPPPRNVD